MYERKLEIKTAKKRKTETETAKTTKNEAFFTPERFSVRGIRKHVGIKTSRTPNVIH